MISERSFVRSLILVGTFTLATACGLRPVESPPTPDVPKPPISIPLEQNPNNPRQFGRNTDTGTHAVEFDKEGISDDGKYVWQFNRPFNLIMPTTITIQTQTPYIMIGVTHFPPDSLEISVGDQSTQTLFGRTEITNGIATGVKSSGLTALWERKQLINASLR